MCTEKYKEPEQAKPMRSPPPTLPIKGILQKSMDVTPELEKAL